MTLSGWILVNPEQGVALRTLIEADEPPNEPSMAGFEWQRAVLHVDGELTEGKDG